ncbi:WAS/WASL-interacting protein family member 1-like [Cuculus canorus]|uniref:WAS/WASL-interacting protein family member 1-like n=1 Tax=Cuculus canorus TaxID=55661 RepID=UPI0023AA92F6|nr:WAS/WASL-interacting protein family member 1-like [Cuculus canorus]
MGAHPAPALPLPHQPLHGRRLRWPRLCPAPLVPRRPGESVRGLGQRGASSSPAHRQLPRHREHPQGTGSIPRTPRASPVSAHRAHPPGTGSPHDSCAPGASPTPTQRARLPGTGNLHNSCSPRATPGHREAPQPIFPGSLPAYREPLRFPSTGRRSLSRVSVMTPPAQPHRCGSTSSRGKSTPAPSCVPAPRLPQLCIGSTDWRMQMQAVHVHLDMRCPHSRRGIAEHEASLRKSNSAPKAEPWVSRVPAQGSFGLCCCICPLTRRAGT